MSGRKVDVRAFIALEIPKEIKDYCRSVITGMSRRIDGTRWVRDEGIHITLKFLGDIERDKIKEIHHAIAHIGKEHGPVHATLDRIDAFPDRRRARVIVVEFEKGVDNVQRIFNDIEGRLTEIGFEKESRQFRPHLTLGRRKLPAPLLEKEIPQLDKKSFLLDTVILFESTLTREGSVYTPKLTIILGGVHGKGRSE